MAEIGVALGPVSLTAGGDADVDPFVAFRFSVEIDGVPHAGFSECSGLQLETEVLDYPEGGLNTHVHRFPGRAKQSNIVLKRGVVDRSLWDWYWQLVQGDVRLRTGSIVARDHAGARVTMEWRFQGAFPCKWSGPDLNATQGAVAVESLELCHRGVERVV